MPSALVLDGNERSALAIVRSLGRRSVAVRVASDSTSSLAASSRYCADAFSYRAPTIDSAGFLDDLYAASPPGNDEWLLPATDATTMLLVADTRFAGRLLTPSSTSYEQLTDKARLIDSAVAVGVEVPETIVIRSMDEALPAVRSIGRPIVIKPSRSRYLSDGRIRSTQVVIAASQDHAIDLLASAAWFPQIPALVQRYIPGAGAGVFALFWDGKPVCWFAHRRLLERPPWGGVSVLSESAALDPALIEPSLRLLSHAKWSGLAMVEFRVAVDGTPWLMEVNARPWGSLQLAIDSGVDFPWLLYCCAQGLPYEAPGSYEVGRRLHWTLGDLDRLLLLLRGRSPAHRTTSRLGHMSAFLSTTLRHAHRSEVLRLSDPMPGIFEIRRWLGDALRPRSRRKTTGPA